MEEKILNVSYHPLAESVPIKDEILDKWESFGSKTCLLGCPLYREVVYKNNCRMQKFQNGVIVYHPEFGAHNITGKFYYYWALTVRLIIRKTIPKYAVE